MELGLTRDKSSIEADDSSCSTTAPTVESPSENLTTSGSQRFSWLELPQATMDLLHD